MKDNSTLTNCCNYNRKLTNVSLRVSFSFCRQRIRALHATHNTACHLTQKREKKIKKRVRRFALKKRGKILKGILKL